MRMSPMILLRRPRLSEFQISSIDPDPQRSPKNCHKYQAYEDEVDEDSDDAQMKKCAQCHQ